MGLGLKIAGGAFATLAVLTAVIIYIGGSIDSIVESGIEKYGSEILKARVRVDAVEISPQSGKGTLRGVSIGNPDGFETESAFKLDEVTITLDLGTVTGNPIVIKEIRVIAPQLTYEVNENGNNLGALQKNVAAYTGDDTSKKTASAKEDTDEEEARKLVIEKLTIQNGTIGVSASSIQDGTAEVPLPNLEFKNIGKEKDGTTPGDVAAKLLDAVTQQVVVATAGLGLKAVQDAAEESLKGVGDVLEDGADGIGDALESLF
jgi:hypothetical protein